MTVKCVIVCFTRLESGSAYPVHVKFENDVSIHVSSGLHFANCNYGWKSKCRKRDKSLDLSDIEFCGFRGSVSYRWIDVRVRSADLRRVRVHRIDVFKRGMTTEDRCDYAKHGMTPQDSYPTYTPVLSRPNVTDPSRPKASVTRTEPSVESAVHVTTSDDDAT